jgi:PIN domain nuclease of toxin-antitoxin system
MSDYIADTHSLLWYFAQPHRLGPQATAALAEVTAGTANLIVPIITLAEMIFVLESRRVQADFNTIIRTLQAMPNAQIVGFSLIRTLDLRTLTAIPEMHDRMIVAEAIAYGATLITRDTTITNSGLVRVVW